MKHKTLKAFLTLGLLAGTIQAQSTWGDVAPVPPQPNPMVALFHALFG